MTKELKLTKDNIEQWKAVLRSEMLRQYEIDEYDSTISDEEWLDIHEGETPQDAIDEEVSNWND